MHTLVFLDPGHFHAALTLRERNRRVTDRIVVYGPDGDERREFLALVDAFNRRAERSTAWQPDVRTTDDPLGRALADRAGDVAILAGRNDRKANWIRRLHDAGFHVLADKPWMTSPDAIDDVRGALGAVRGALGDGALTAEIMTGRHEITSIRCAELVRDRAVFGDVRAIRLESVHHLEKTVNGVPLRRPAWYFDVRVQGNGVADIPTHLVDQAQWLLGAEGDPIELVDARVFATRVPRALFQRVTGASEFPRELRDRVTGDALDYFSNTELMLRLRGVTIEIAARWDLSVAPGGGDTHTATITGTNATVRVEQGPQTKFRRRLTLEPQGEAAREIEIPDALRTGHESHFPLVLDDFLRAVDAGERPAGTANTRAKYELLAQALAAVSG